MNHLMKLSRLGKPRATPLCSLMSRNASHFTYVPDAPMENMGKQDFFSYDLFILKESNVYQHFIHMASTFFKEFILNYVEKNVAIRIKEI
jgi:hypothetical protein